MDMKTAVILVLATFAIILTFLSTINYQRSLYITKQKRLDLTIVLGMADSIKIIHNSIQTSYSKIKQDSLEHKLLYYEGMLYALDKTADSINKTDVTHYLFFTKKKP